MPGMRVGVALVMAGALVAVGCGGGIGNGCSDYLDYRSLDLLEFCRDSGSCPYSGPACSDDQSRCPFGTIAAGTGPATWSIPLDHLGSAGAGLDVVDVEVSSDAAMPVVGFHIDVAGQTVCTFHAGDLTPSFLQGACQLSGSPKAVELALVGDHPAFDLFAKLEESTPTRHVEICGE